MGGSKCTVAEVCKLGKMYYFNFMIAKINTIFIHLFKNRQSTTTYCIWWNCCYMFIYKILQVQRSHQTLDLFTGRGWGFVSCYENKENCLYLSRSMLIMFAPSLPVVYVPLAYLNSSFLDQTATCSACSSCLSHCEDVPGVNTSTEF